MTLTAADATRCSACGAANTLRRDRPAGTPRLCERCFLERTHRGYVGNHTIDAGAFVEALVETVDLREHETGLHSRRVACHTLVLARQLADDPQILQQIYWGALLHDFGKIAVPDRILLKHGPLNEEEWEIMRRHPEDGFHIVSQLPGMDLAAQVVLCHEERFDGSGYPRGLAGKAIPMGARLFAVIDTLDAMTSDRPYRRGVSFDAAKAEIEAMANRQFDPIAVDAMSSVQELLRKMVDMKCAQINASDF